ncbi:MAG: sulfotransferase domain-containing protein [Desulfobacula sp.]|nr:sulfotransferase domain-containing protein [Desulfobacula sp.]
MNNIKQLIKFKLIHPIRSSILKTNYLLSNYKKIIWIIGDGRSGTTWVSHLINYKKQFREMFEPFHPNIVKDKVFFIPHQYIRADDINHQMRDFATNVFNGKFINYKVDKDNNRIFYSGLLIKDIFANLLAYWVSHNFSQVKIILLIRNPFAIALSKYKTRQWYWMTNPADFLKQPELFQDYLYPFKDLIIETNNRNDFIQNQILIWAIINYIPLLQFKPETLHVMFYEEALNDPDNTLSNVFNHINPKNKNQQINIPGTVIHRPSKTTCKDSHLLAGKSHICSWKNQLKASQIDAGLKILSKFGLENLYNDESMPNRSIIEKIFNSNN